MRFTAYHTGSMPNGTGNIRAISPKAAASGSCIHSALGHMATARLRITLRNSGLTSGKLSNLRSVPSTVISAGVLLAGSGSAVCSQLRWYTSTASSRRYSARNWRSNCHGRSTALHPALRTTCAIPPSAMSFANQLRSLPVARYFAPSGSGPGGAQIASDMSFTRASANARLRINTPRQSPSSSG